MSDNAHDYPEILSELATAIADLAHEQGLAKDKATELGHLAAEHMRARWGGFEVYIPKGNLFTLSARDEQIWNEWNGKNAIELCRKHDITEQRLRQILSVKRAQETRKRQHQLF